MHLPTLKKILIAASLIILAAVVLVPGGFAHAQNAGATGFTGAQAPINNYSCNILSLPTCIVYFISYFLTYIAGFLVAFAIWLVQLGLQFNLHVFDSPVVQTGFGVALSIANLGFVLGIIVVALATIVRRETYGIKQILWKLIFMAILVNFGLVITSPIVSFSTSMSTAFINAIAGGNAGQMSNSGIASGFALKLTGQFSPQSLLQTPTSTAGETSVASVGFMKAIMSLVFNAFFSFVVVVSLLALAILLLVRYVYLGGLLVVLPFAWLAWVFPKFSHENSAWWSNFIKWTFFPPLALFFLYLALTTAGSSTYQTSAGINATCITAGSAAAQNANNDPTSVLTQSMNNGNCPGASGSASPTGPTVLQTVADDILLCGLMIGGLFFAGSLTGKAGSGIVKTAESATKAVGGYVGRKTKTGAAKTARLAYQKTGLNQLGNALQENRGLQWTRKVPILGGVVRRGATITGRGLASVSTNAPEVEGAKKAVPKDREGVLANLKGSMSTAETLAHLDAAAKGKYLKEDTMINGKKAKDYIDDNRDLMKRYGQGKTIDDANKLLMSDSNIRAGEAVLSAKTAQEKAVYDKAYEEKKNEAGTTKADAEKAGNDAKEEFKKETDKKADEASAKAYKATRKEAEDGAVGKEAYDKAIFEGKTPEEAEEAKQLAADKAANDAAELAANEIRGTVVRVLDDIKDDFGKVIYKTGDKIDAKKIMDVAMQQFIKGLTPEDASKMDSNTLFGPSAPIDAINSRLENIALYNPKLMPNLYKNMKYRTVVNMQKKYIDLLDLKTEELKTKIATFEAAASLTDEEKAEKAELEFSRNQLEYAKKGFENLQKSSMSHQVRTTS